MKIITLTLNPAFDTHCSLDTLNLHHENFASITSTDAGGKGVNISRALTANGVENKAVVITGRENQALFLQSLQAEGIDVFAISTEGRIRENITIHEKNSAETRISFEGFACDATILEKVKECAGEVDENTTVTFTGSNPVGLSSGDVTKLLAEWKKKGAKIVIDSRSFTPSELVEFRPFLIKPNKDEAAAFAGSVVDSIEKAANTALCFYKKGVENVIISLGEEGAVLACSDGVLYASAPEITAVSTIGAGDSMIAGFVAATAQGLDKKEALAQAVAFGSAACLQQGTRAPDPKDVAEIKRNIIVNFLHI